MRQSKYHRDIPNNCLPIGKKKYEHITMNDKDELIGYYGFGSLVLQHLEHLDIDEKIRLVGELIERKAHELEGYTELAAGLIIQQALPDAKVVRKK